jgi:hypothetical protein
MTETGQLALEIRQVLNDLVTGRSSEDSAREKYASLLQSYKDLSLKAGPAKGDSFSGLCYAHNTENFSLHTGIFRLHGKGAECLASFGLDGADETILFIVESIRNSVSVKKYLEFSPSDGTGLKQILHVYVFECSGDDFGIIASLSSSPYFNKMSFIYYGNFLETLFPSKRIKPYGTSDLFHAIDRQIEMMSPDIDLYAYIVYFPDLDMIFSHTGIQMLFDVSHSLEIILSQSWGAHHPRYTLSLKEYAVLISCKKNSDIPVQNKRIDFSFKGIPLPHHSAVIKLEGSDAFYQFTKALFALSLNK